MSLVVAVGTREEGGGELWLDVGGLWRARSGAHGLCSDGGWLVHAPTVGSAARIPKHGLATGSGWRGGITLSTFCMVGGPFIAGE